MKTLKNLILVLAVGALAAGCQSKSGGYGNGNVNTRGQDSMPANTVDSSNGTIQSPPNLKGQDSLTNDMNNSGMTNTN